MQCNKSGVLITQFSSSARDVRRLNIASTERERESSPQRTQQRTQSKLLPAMKERRKERKDNEPRLARRRRKKCIESNKWQQKKQQQQPWFEEGVRATKQRHCVCCFCCLTPNQQAYLTSAHHTRPTLLSLGANRLKGADDCKQRSERRANKRTTAEWAKERMND